MGLRSAVIAIRRSDEMIYLKAVAAGVVLALVAAALWVIGNLWLPLYAAEVVCRLRPDCGGGVGAASVGSGSTLLVALAGFAGGAYWILKRARR